MTLQVGKLVMALRKTALQNVEEEEEEDSAVEDCPKS